MATNEEFIKKNKVITVDDDNNTKLHYAAALGNYEEAQKEIAFGRKLDSENYLGWTPLMMAIRNGNMAIVTLLLERGADATKRNKFGMNVFLISVASGDLDILEKILNHLLCGGISRQSLQKTVSPISLAIMFSHPNIFKYLIERSFDVNTATPTTGITPLMFAAAMSNHKAIKKLLQHKADMRQKNYLGKTASEIIESRNQRIEIDNINKQKPPHLPVIVISPHTPNLQLTPYTVANGTQNARKSSNTRTPNLFCTTPNVSPIPPQFIPQVFFPPNFNPNQFVSPAAAYQSYDFLNAAINPNSSFFSPTSPQIYHTGYV